LKAGTRAVWVVDPLARTVAVHRALQAPAVLGNQDVLRDPVLPDFEIRVSDLLD